MEILVMYSRLLRRRFNDGQSEIIPTYSCSGHISDAIVGMSFESFSGCLTSLS